jgi:hypothetical protein
MSRMRGVARAWVGVLLVAALALSELPIAPAVATTRTVDSLSDGPVDAGLCTDAITAAVPNDTITFPLGFSGTITLTASLGSLTLAQPVTIVGPGQGLLIISGGCTTCGPGGARSDGVRVFVDNSGVTATISGVTIERGQATSTAGAASGTAAR